MEQVLLRNKVPEYAAKLAELANNKKIWDNVRDYFPSPTRFSMRKIYQNSIGKGTRYESCDLLQERICGSRWHRAEKKTSLE